MEKMGITVHYEEQFADAPTAVGGVRTCLRDQDKYVVMDVGGDYIGARLIGAYAPGLNAENTMVYYVLNAFRPWSDHIEHIDRTLGDILGCISYPSGTGSYAQQSEYGSRYDRAGIPGRKPAW